MRRVTLGLAAAAMGLACLPAPASAQTMNLEEFVTTANRIPRNPTALIRSDFRRVRREFEAAFEAVIAEQRTARQAGRPPTVCFPAEFEVGAEDSLRRLNAIPQSRRRTMTVTDGVREIMRRRFPCPAS